MPQDSWGEGHTFRPENNCHHLLLLSHSRTYLNPTQPIGCYCTWNIYNGINQKTNILWQNIPKTYIGDVRQGKFQKITKTFQTSKQHTNNHAQRDMKCAFKRLQFEHYGEHCFKGFAIKPLVPYDILHRNPIIHCNNINSRWQTTLENCTLMYKMFGVRSSRLYLMDQKYSKAVIS